MGTRETVSPSIRVKMVITVMGVRVNLRQRKILPVARKENDHKEKTIVPTADFSLVIIM